MFCLLIYVGTSVVTSMITGAIGEVVDGNSSGGSLEVIIFIISFCAALGLPPLSTAYFLRGATETKQITEASTTVNQNPPRPQDTEVIS